MAHAFQHHVAVGDPQGSWERFQGVLRHHGLLGHAGRLRDDVQLVSIGDHFDWGGRANWRRATADATRLLEWLAAHAPQQVVLIAGNHDLARVCELDEFDDATFRRARREAWDIYRLRERDRRAFAARQARFVARFRGVATAEVLARDFSAFDTAQRELVGRLLRAGRFRLAHAHRGRLLVHAGVTTRNLAQAGAGFDDAARVARALNAFLDARVKAWRAGPLDLSPYHVPGDARGEGGGALYHRPADPAHEAAHKFDPARPRRFDPRTLPAAFTQVIGHVAHAKCAELMPDWTRGPRRGFGPIRSLAFDGERPVYRQGVQPGARLLFIDNGLQRIRDVRRYQLLDLDRGEPFSPLRSGR